MATSNYNPDVLNCIANLSNDEVFTPPELANRVLDLLPPELFTNPKTTFLDPFTKSGVFLREIVKRLDRGIEPQIPDRRERIDHILHNQVFGIAITELTSYLSRRSVYCSKTANGKYSVSKFSTPSGNILYKNLTHTWENGKCKYCGASQTVYDRGQEAEQYAYMFIHTDNPNTFFNNMKFDVIIGNPPYQLADGGNGVSAVPIFNLFVGQAKNLSPRFLSMIIPARWYAGGKGLDSFRDNMLSDNHISKLVDFESSKDCFDGVNIAGGICYFLWERDYYGPCEVTNVFGTNSNTMKRRLSEYPIFIRSNQAVSILKKVVDTKSKNIESYILSQKPFGFRTYERGQQEYNSGDIKLITSEGFGYVNRNQVSKNADLIDRFKVYVGRFVPSNGELDIKPGEKYRVFTNPKMLSPEEICTETYIVVGTFATQKESENYISYLMCKFTRMLVRIAISSVNISQEVFRFVPVQDFSHPWTDEMLYKKYGLTEDEIAFIESMIRPME